MLHTINLQTILYKGLDMLSWLVSEAWKFLATGLCLYLLIWFAWWMIRDSVRKVVREELDKESRDRTQELVELYAFLQNDESDERDSSDGDQTPGLMSRIRSVVRDELIEHERAERSRPR